MEQTPSKDGTLIGFWRSGSGPPLLLVHGTQADHTRWSKILPRLEQHFTVFAMDRRGRGASGDAAGYAIQREAEDVAAVIEAVNEQAGEPVSVLAHSYGAVCTLEAALLVDPIRRLILYEPPIPTGLAMYPPGLPEQIDARVQQGELESALEMFLQQVVKMPADELSFYRQLPTWPTRVSLAPTIQREMVIDQKYRFQPEKFASLAMPILLLRGSDSPPLFQKAVEQLASALPASRVVSLPGQQHIAMDTSPELFLREVLDFLLV